MLKKVRSEDDRGFQRFLDNVQYKSSGILRYERVFGPGFVSTGGIGTSHSLCFFSPAFFMHSINILRYMNLEFWFYLPFESTVSFRCVGLLNNKSKSLHNDQDESVGKGIGKSVIMLMRDAVQLFT